MDTNARNEKLATMLEAVEGSQVCPNGLPLQVYAPTEPELRRLAGQAYSYLGKHADNKRIVWEVRPAKRDVKQPTSAEQNGPVHERKADSAEAAANRAARAAKKAADKQAGERVRAAAGATVTPPRAHTGASTVAVTILVHTNGRVEIIPAK